MPSVPAFSLAGTLSLALWVAAPLPAQGGTSDLFAAVGSSRQTRAVAAAEEATRLCMDQFSRAGRVPGVIVFTERVDTTTHALSADIGNHVKSLAKGIPTYGEGGNGTYGIPIVNGRESSPPPTFLVLGIAGANLEVQAYVDQGPIDHIWWPTTPEGKAVQDSLKAICADRARALAEQMTVSPATRFLWIMGALHNYWHRFFIDGMREVIGDTVPVFGGVGQFGDWVYCDGRSLVDKDGAATVIGQLVLAVSGDFDAALTGVSSGSLSPQTVEEQLLSLGHSVREGLNGGTPRLLLAFGCHSRLEKLQDEPGHEYAAIRTAFGPDLPVFGYYSGGEAGIDIKGKVFTGGGALMVAGLGYRARQAAYGGAPNLVPGTIQAEDFDSGGAYASYYDTDTVNAPGRYRPLEGVDIDTIAAPGGGYAVVATRQGEWLEYTVEVADSGLYDIRVRAAPGGGMGLFTLAMDGKVLSAPEMVPLTGGPGHWETTVTSNVNLGAGVHTMRITIDYSEPDASAGAFDDYRIDKSGNASAAGPVRTLHAGAVNAPELLPVLGGIPRDGGTRRGVYDIRGRRMSRGKGLVEVGGTAAGTRAPAILIGVIEPGEHTGEEPCGRATD